MVLWVAGGASRADAFGQVVVRGAAAIVTVAMVLLAPRPFTPPAKPVWLLLSAAVGLAVLQTVPLPPGVWTALPGRQLFVEAAAASGQAQPWRPLAIVPGAAANAAASLLVPVAVLMAAAGLDDAERRRLPGVLLILVVAAMLIGLLQFSGVRLNNPFINDVTGQVGGSFANRNHLALFLAVGCLLAPAWAFLDGRRPGWRAPVALGLVVVLLLMVIATGSRAGTLLGVLGTLVGCALVGKEARRMSRRYPRWVVPAIAAAAAAVVAALVLLSIAAGRAVAVDRAFAVDPGQDMRSRGLPTVLDMIRQYFPAGSGLGGFDPIFRVHEPFELLKPTYFNHAHNDYLEIVLDAGLPGLGLLAAGLGWWLWASAHAWRFGSGATLSRLGSAVLLLIILASAVDYPARTPMVMATIVIAALWLADQRPSADDPLPDTAQQL